MTPSSIDRPVPLSAGALTGSVNRFKLAVFGTNDIAAW